MRTPRPMECFMEREIRRLFIQKCEAVTESNLLLHPTFSSERAMCLRSHMFALRSMIATPACGFCHEGCEKCVADVGAARDREARFRV